MTFRNKWNRRNFLGATGLIAGWAAAPRKVFSGKLRTAIPEPLPNVYDDLGVTTVINGQGTMTALGGSLIPLEVDAAMAAASHHFVRITELQVAAGNRIA